MKMLSKINYPSSVHGLHLYNLCVKIEIRYFLYLSKNTFLCSGYTPIQIARSEPLLPDPPNKPF